MNFTLLERNSRVNVDMNKYIALVISGLLTACNDINPDVRLNADEALSRVIKVCSF
jgi:hypothetical protein